MKKALVILLALTIVGAAFAQDVVTPTFSGSVSGAWGYDLQDEVGGFKNSIDFDVVFPFATQGKKSLGEGDMYGQILIEDFGLKIVSEDKGDPKTKIGGDDYAITGKIVVDKMFMKIYSRPGYNINFAPNYRWVENDNADEVDININNDYIDATGGMEIGYATELLTVSLTANSVGNWESERAENKKDDDVYKSPFVRYEGVDDGKRGAPNADDKYITSAYLKLAPMAGLTVEGRFTYYNKFEAGMDKDGEEVTVTLSGIGAKLAYDVKPFKASIGVDAVMLSEGSAYVWAKDAVYSEDLDAKAVTLFDIAPAVSYAVVDGFDLGLKAYAYGDTLGTDASMPVNVEFSVTEALKTGFVPNLGVVAKMGLLNVLGNDDVNGNAKVYAATHDDAGDDVGIEWDGSVEVSYMLVDGLTVKGKVGYDYNATTKYSGSLELAPAFHKIANTTFTAAFADGKIEGKDNTGKDKGVVTFTAKIAY